MCLNKRGFTLVELLVVIAMIAVILAAFSTSVTAARQRSRIQKATAEVNAISQAILASENWVSSGGKYELDIQGGMVEVSRSSLARIFGGGNAESGGKIPVMLQASLGDDGKMRDPWGHPYWVRITKNTFTPVFKTATGSMTTGFYLPNLYRLKDGER
jgi:prepilin-type N-terminal cleavage/methylation domain-containing protein